jgi:dihydrofolate reductase
MARLIYTTIASLDGFIVDPDGRFDFAAPDAELHGAINERERSVGTYLYGRRIYETMLYWETNGDGPEDAAEEQEYAAIWRAADKIVYSTTLEQVTTARTRLERRFDADAVRALKESAERDLGIGSTGVAADAFAAGLVDEFHIYLHPIAVGGGKPALPPGQRLPLELFERHEFGSGVVHLGYRCRATAT